MNKIAIANLDDLTNRKPEYALVGEVDLVVVRIDDEVSVFYGRCLHRGALMADGFVRGKNLICGVHYWDYRLDSGVSSYNSNEALPKFKSWIRNGRVLVNEDEILAELLPRAVATQIFSALLENRASEQGARMSAMDNATRNAGDMIDKLTIQYNRSRQAVITNELIEIISGAEAL